MKKPKGKTQLQCAFSAKKDSFCDKKLEEDLDYEISEILEENLDYEISEILEENLD